MALVRYIVPALVGGLLWAARLGAQDPTGTISGRVIDSTSQRPVSGVAVVIVGTGRGTLTGDAGNFALSAVPVGTHTVMARRIGYASQQQTVAVRGGEVTTVEFALPPAASVLEQVVTTGYGTQRRLAITGSIASIDADEANVGVAPNVNNLIQGRAAGVMMTTNSGEPGADAQIRIRGGTSISASNEPLYVIDGVPVADVDVEPAGISLGNTPPLPRSALNLLNPADIASISILKDAAASIYGSRAANGVVLIETKKGAAGAPTIEYDTYVGVSSPERYLDVLDGNEYRTFIQQQIAAGDLPATADDDLGQASTDWEREITQTAVTHNHNLSFAGGSASTQYRASLNYMDQQGIVLSSGLKRYQARLNGTHQALDGRLRLALNLTGAQTRNDYLASENTGGFIGGVFINSLLFNPTQPIRVTDEATGQSVYYEIGPGSQTVRNPIALAEQLQDDGKTNLWLGNISGELDILPSLTGRVNVGVNRTDGTRSTYWPRASPAGAQFEGRARQVSRENTLVTLQTVVTFRPQVFSADHSFDILGGYEFNESVLSEFGAEARSFLTDALGYNRLESGSILLPPFSFSEERRIVGFFSRANYSYLDRYFLTASIRRDGASQFGAGNKWAVFPAISGSWRISEEPFARGSLGPLSELRLRAGWGLLGNPAVPPYASLITLSAESGSRYVFGESFVTGFRPIRNPNPNLKWEETAQTNVALDYGLSNNRFTGSIEYYIKNTNDLLLEVTVPQPALVDTRLENIGKIRNTGVEFSLDAQVLDQPSLSWSAGLVFSRERNKVVDLGGRTFIATGGGSGEGASGAQTQRIIPGEPLGTFWGPQFVGVNPQGQEEFACTSTGPTDTQCVNGRMTQPPRASDFRIIGNANPDFTLGLRSQANFGGFDASFLINSQFGQDVYNNTANVYATKNNAKQSQNFLASALNDGVDIEEPQVFSSRFIEDGSFVRLQNVTVGYTFNPPAFTRLTRGARVYVSGDNLLLLTDYSGYDPEVHTESGLASRGIDYLHYPRARTFTGGIRVSF
jgi:TonB-linked SusC/RagA family outer membrane protein